MLDADDDYWQEKAEDLGVLLDEESASEAYTVVYTSPKRLMKELPGSGLEFKLMTLNKVMNKAVRHHLATESTMKP